MSVNDKNNAHIRDSVLGAGIKLQSFYQVLTGNLTLNNGLPPVVILDPGGAGRDVLLPNVANSRDEVMVIVNDADAAETLTVKTHDDVTTVGTVAQNERAVLHCDGTDWRIISSV
jgi:hypothetical protein